jgi:hypothetical protein
MHGLRLITDTRRLAPKHVVQPSLQHRHLLTQSLGWASQREHRGQLDTKMRTGLSLVFACSTGPLCGVALCSCQLRHRIIVLPLQLVRSSERTQE